MVKGETESLGGSQSQPMTPSQPPVVPGQGRGSDPAMAWTVCRELDGSYMDSELSASPPRHFTPAPRTVPSTQWVCNAHTRPVATSPLQLVAGEPQLLLLKPRGWGRQSVVELLPDGPGVGKDPGTPGA